MHLRSLVLLVIIFAASAALAGLVGMKYDDHASKPAAQSPAPTLEREVQSINTLAPSSGQDSLSKPAAPIVSTTETLRTPTLSSTSQVNKPQDIQRTADDSRKPIGSPSVESGSATASNGQRPKCNIRACENAYRSFDPADCTYLPANGPRRTCRK